jgi:hypothetical protein
MTKCRIIYKNYWRTAGITNRSSEHPQFPAENTQIDTPTEVWRTRYGTGSGNGLFVIPATATKIDFVETSPELTATLTAGSYNGTSLAAELQTKMRAVGAILYVVTYVESSGLFNIYGPTNFNILWNTGTHVSNSVGPYFGFSLAANDTGTNSYSSDYRRIHCPSELIELDLGAAVACDSLALMNHNISSAATLTIVGADDSAFTTNAVTVTLSKNANNLYGFMTSMTKRYFRIEIADPTNTNSYIQIGTIVLGKYWEPGSNFQAGYEDGTGDESTVQASDSLVEFGQDKPTYGLKTLPFTALGDADKAEALLFAAWTKTVFGFALCVDYNYPNANSYFLRNVELTLPANRAFGYWDWSISAKEVS